MRLEDSTKQRFEKLKRQLQDAILTEYPNPERKGCPGAGAVRKLAELPLAQDIEQQPDWYHVTHCSECYREFLAARAELTTHAETWRTQLRWGLAAAMVVIAAGGLYVAHPAWIFPKRPQNAELAYAKRVVRVEAMSRSGETPKESVPVLLKREREELTIQLPVGSRGGQYEFQLRKGTRQIIGSNADAAIRDGTTAFTVKVDLSNLDPGRYAIYIRQAPWDWGYYPVDVR